MGHGLGEAAKLCGVDPALRKGDFLEARHLQRLPFLYGLYIVRCLRKRLESPGVQPGESPLELLHLQKSFAQIMLIYRGYLVLSARGFLNSCGYVHHAVRVEIKPHHRVMALRLLRFLLYAQAPAVLVELRHSIAPRVTYPVSEYRSPSAIGLLCRTRELLLEPCAVEDIVSQHQRHTVLADKLPSYRKRLGQTLRPTLLRVLESHSQLTSVAKQSLEARQILRSADNQNVPNPRVHKNAYRVIHHRLVVNGHQLLANPFSDRI